jgi:hypothetical protein
MWVMQTLKVKVRVLQGAREEILESKRLALSFNKEIQSQYYQNISVSMEHCHIQMVW